MKKMTKKKKLFRKVTALAAVIALGTSLAGCGSSGEETTQRYSWPLATASPEDTVTQIFAEKFAEEISELSDGRMKIQVYANSTLGGDRDLLETCADGILLCLICRVCLILSMNAVRRLIIRSFTS